MFIFDEELKNVVKSNVDGYDESNIGTVSYDLRIDKVILTAQENKEVSTYKLKPGETVFVSSKEYVKFPLNCVGVVSIRNSCIRYGLQIETPYYHPGHETKIFMRVTNISNNYITLNKDESIANLMFDKLETDVKEGYNGKFAKQFTYNDVSDFQSAKLPQLERAEKVEKNIQQMESNIYHNVITIMTIFIGIFSLINLNINMLQATIDTKFLVVFNLLIITCLGMLITMVAVVLGKKKSIKIPLFLMSTGLFVVTVISYFKL